MAAIAMMTSNQLSLNASPTTEDDGYTYPDDASEDEKEEIDEQEQEAWEEAGRPGEEDDNGDDNDNDEENGNDNDDKPYCDQDDSGSCWDRKDYDEETGLYPCKNGSQVTDWRNCTDNKYSNSNKLKVIQKETVIPSSNANAADISSCKLDGSADGIQQKFNPIRYQACKLHTNNDKIYYDGFVAGCMQVGNTKLICETVANSNIVVPPAQMQTALPPQPTQAIHPSAVS
jgi:hypothetical protein